MNAFTQAMTVGAGGFVGSILRYGIGSLANRLAPAAIYPYGTLVVNVVGCLAIGLLTGLTEYRQTIGPGLKLFLFVGVLGGFTTFSAFGNQTLALAREGAPWQAGLNVVLTLVLCLVSVSIGYSISAR